MRVMVFSVSPDSIENTPIYEDFFLLSFSSEGLRMSL